MPRISLRWLVLALIPIAGLLGVLAAGGGEDPTTTGSTPPPDPIQVEAEIAAVTVPGTWREADALAVPGLELAGVSTAAPADAEDIGISVGTTTGTGPALLPPLFTKLLDEPPGPGEPVRLGDIAAYRYAGLQPDGVDGELTLYVAPTNRGVAIVALAGSGGPRAPARRRAATLILADGATRSHSDRAGHTRAPSTVAAARAPPQRPRTARRFAARRPGREPDAARRRRRLRAPRASTDAAQLTALEGDAHPSSRPRPSAAGRHGPRSLGGPQREEEPLRRRSLHGPRPRRRSAQARQRARAARLRRR